MKATVLSLLKKLLSWIPLKIRRSQHDSQCVECQRFIDSLYQDMGGEA